MTLLLIALLACDPAVPPAPLPPEVRTEPKTVGRMVKAGPVVGFIARPRSATPPLPGLVLRASAIDDAARAEALRRAEDGVVALVIDPTIDAEQALTYVRDMPDVGDATLQCLGAACP